MRKIAPTLILTLVLAGCGNSAARSTPVLGIGVTPGKSLATIWLSPTAPVPVEFTPEPTFTPAPTLPLPTPGAPVPTLAIGTIGPLLEPESEATEVGTPGPLPECSSLPPEPFVGVWTNSPATQQALGCPLGSAQERTAAYQPYEQGFMFWIQAEDSIYVLANSAIRQGQETDSWWRLADTWSEGEPATDESLFAPEGLLQPARGFGKVWRNNGFVREAVGWATATEQGYTAERLDFEGGWMLAAPGGRPIFAFLPSDDPSSDSGVHRGPQNPSPAPIPDQP